MPEAKQPRDQEPESPSLRTSQHNTPERDGTADDPRCSINAFELALCSASQTDISVPTVKAQSDLSAIQDSSANTNLLDATEQSSAEGIVLPTADILEHSKEPNDGFRIELPAAALSRPSEFGQGTTLPGGDQAQSHGFHENENESSHSDIPEMMETGLCANDVAAVFPFSDTLATAEENGCMTAPPDVPGGTTMPETETIAIPIAIYHHNQDVSKSPKASLPPIFEAINEEIERTIPAALNEQEAVEQQARKAESPVPIETEKVHIISTAGDAMGVERPLEDIETHKTEYFLEARLESPERDQFNQVMTDPAVTDASQDATTMPSFSQTLPPATASPTSVSAPGFARGSAPVSDCSAAQEAFMAGISDCQILPNAEISSISPRQSPCLHQIAEKAEGIIDAIEAECVWQVIPFESIDILAESQSSHVISSSSSSSSADDFCGAPAGAVSTGKPFETNCHACHGPTPVEPMEPSDPSELYDADTTIEPTGPTVTGNVPINVPQVLEPAEGLDSESLQTDAVYLSEQACSEKGMEIEILELPANNGPQDFSETAPAAEANFEAAEKIHTVENLSALDLAENVTEHKTRTHDRENPSSPPPMVDIRPIILEAGMLREDTIDQTEHCIEKGAELGPLTLQKKSAYIASALSAMNIQPMFELFEPQSIGSPPVGAFDLPEQEMMEQDVRIQNSEPQTSDDQAVSTMSVEILVPSTLEAGDSQKSESWQEVSLNLLEGDKMEKGIELSLTNFPSIESHIDTVERKKIVFSEELLEGGDLENGKELSLAKLRSNDSDIPSTALASNTVEPTVVFTKVLLEGDDLDMGMGLGLAELSSSDSDIPSAPVAVNVVEPTVVLTEELIEDNLEKGMEIGQTKLPSYDSDIPATLLAIHSPTVVCTEVLLEGGNLEEGMELGLAKLPSNDNDVLSAPPRVIITVEPTFVFDEELEGDNLEKGVELDAKFPSKASDIPSAPLAISTVEPTVEFTEADVTECLPVFLDSKLLEREPNEQGAEFDNIQPRKTHDENASAHLTEVHFEPCESRAMESFPVVAASDLSEGRQFDQVTDFETLPPSAKNHETSTPKIPAEMNGQENLDPVEVRGIEDLHVISSLDLRGQETVENLTNLEKSPVPPEFPTTAEMIVEIDKTEGLLVPNTLDLTGQESMQQIDEPGLDFRTALEAPNVEHLVEPTEIQEDIGFQETSLSETESPMNAKGKVAETVDLEERYSANLGPEESFVSGLGCSQSETPKQSDQKAQSPDASESVSQKLHSKQASSVILKKQSKGKFRNPTVGRQVAVAAGALLQRKKTPIAAEIPVPHVAAESNTNTHDKTAAEISVPTPTKKRKTFRTPTSVPRQSFEPRTPLLGGKSANTIHLIQSPSIGIKQLGLSASQLSVMVRKDPAARALLLIHTQLEKRVASVADGIEKVRYAEKLVCNGVSETTQKLHSKWLAACRMALEELRDLIGPRTHEFDEREPKNLVQEPRKRRSKKAKREVSDSEDDENDDEDEKSWAAFIAGMPGFEQEPNQEIESDDDSCSDTSSNGDIAESENPDSIHANSSAREGGTWSLMELGAKLGIDVKALGKYDQENDCFE
ncbi:hypothetical protein HDU78_001486 [Chytriomyces hyalinus]|nr:hypothetical protein HDU78_001486 [Chytriomyces hyalinus]